MNGQKRAEVWRAVLGYWFVSLHDRPLSPYNRGRRISDRIPQISTSDPFPTHADALKWAIEQTHDTTGEQA